MDSPEPVRCADCGYLSAKEKPADPAFREVPQHRREGGAPEHASHAPYCLRGHPIDKEYEPPGPGEKVAAFLTVINTPRACPDHCKYVPGNSPKEHLQMDAIRLAADRADRKDAEQRRWQEEQLAKQAQLQKELADQQFRQKIWLAVVGVVIALVSFGAREIYEHLFPKQPPAPPAQTAPR